MSDQLFCCWFKDRSGQWRLLHTGSRDECGKIKEWLLGRHSDMAVRVLRKGKVPKGGDDPTLIQS
jgi:hypothetical protein